ncbi:hypothetical protein [Clostridium sp.]|uniref:hypothetical protein n=1 Tax=Clostridium sp. TaxID=1506 RepID=UPI002849D251|nr:hypothetical protein [Clostridium sp.]MDR3593909.1 hypothetical protein [Clostridium sp.]
MDDFTICENCRGKYCFECTLIYDPILRHSCGYDNEYVIDQCYNCDDGMPYKSYEDFD